MVKNMKRWLTALGTASLAFFINTISVFAQGSSTPTLLPKEAGDTSGLGTDCANLADLIRSGRIHLNNVPCFIMWITQTLVAIGGSLAVIFIMVGGYQYILSGPDDKEAAKKTILYAVIGLVVALMAWILVDVILKAATE
jgi:hypothetical protein